MPRTASKKKNEAWKACSQYVRTRDCFETTGHPFVGVCITCRRRFHIDALDAGHCWSGRGNAVLFMVEFIFAQCTYCNQIKHGRSKEFEKILRGHYGNEKVDLYNVRRRRIVQDRDIDFDKLRKGYKKMTKKLYEKHGYSTVLDILKWDSK